MKLKHPVVLSLTSICHCNLERENGRETKRKTKRKGWFRRSEGRSFLILVDRRDVRTGRNEVEVTEEDQRISRDRRTDGT